MRRSLFLVPQFSTSSSFDCLLTTSANVADNTITDKSHDEKSSRHSSVNHTQTPNISKESINWDHARRLFLLAKSEWKLLLGALLSLGVSSGTTLLFPAAIGKIIDIITKPSGLAGSELNTLILGLVILFGIGAFSSFVRVNLMTIASERIVANLRKSLFASLLKQEVAFFDMKKTGELVNRLSSDCTLIGKTLVDNMAHGIRRVVEGVGGLCVLVYLAPKLTLTMLLVMPPVFLAAVYYGRKIAKLAKEQTDALARATSVAEEKLSSIRTVRYFAQEEREVVHYGQKVQEVFEIAKRVGFWSGLFYGGVWFAMNCSLLAVLYHGGSLVLRGVMTTGELTSFLLYSLYVGFAFSGISNFYADFMRALGASQRVFELLDRIPDSTQKGDVRPDRIDGLIELKDVDFIYPTRPNEPVLRKLSLTLEPGKILAVVGPSGSGKSTIAALLTRLYEPNNGQILLDGRPLNTIDPQWLRRQIGVVPQDVILFSGTIEENIRYAAPEASESEVIEAAKQANAHDFVMQFSKGYRTEVGEKGVTLSGGQKQRIAIARAMLKNPKILILDEATSALDVESEYLVQQALERLIHGRTVLIIAHRLSTIRRAHKIAVLNKGTVVEFGTYEELMKANGAFRQLVQRQEL